MLLSKVALLFCAVASTFAAPLPRPDSLVPEAPEGLPAKRLTARGWPISWLLGGILVATPPPSNNDQNGDPSNNGNHQVTDLPALNAPPSNSPSAPPGVPPGTTPATPPTNSPQTQGATSPSTPAGGSLNTLPYTPSDAQPGTSTSSPPQPPAKRAAAAGVGPNLNSYDH